MSALVIINGIIVVYTDPPALLSIILMIRESRKTCKKNNHNIYFLTFCISVCLRSYKY